MLVNTVDSFQGPEADVVILSCVRTNQNSVGFLTDSRRLNVSLTCAKKKLIVLANSKALVSRTTADMFDLRALINNAKERNLLFSESDLKFHFKLD